MEFQHELIIPNEGLPFKLFLFEGGSGNYEREKHWHTSIEIFTVLEGQLSFFLNDREHPLEAGELIIINSNEIHSIRAQEKNRTVVLQIPLKQFEGYFTAQRFIRFKDTSREQTPMEQVLAEQSANPFANPSANQALAALIQELYQVYMARDVGYEFRCISLFYNVLYLMVKDYRETEAEEKDIRYSRRLDALSKITTYMREHYTEDLKLSDLAVMFGYSEAYLSRMFRKYAKVNFKSYLQDIRMAYAYRELMNTDHTISKIALDNGFSSSRGFSKEFQRRYGCLPSSVVRK